MMLTTKGRYAVEALAFMTLKTDGKPTRVEDISKHCKISQHYLEQLFRKMRLAGIVASTRGAGGGYTLSYLPELLTIDRVFKAVGENVPVNDAIFGNALRNHLEHQTLQQVAATIWGNA